MKYESLWIRHTWTCKNVNTFIINWKKLWTCHMVNLMEVHKEALVHMFVLCTWEKNEVSKSSSAFMMYIDLLCKASVVVLMHWAWSVLYFCKCYIGWKACDGVDNLYKANVLFFVLCHNYFDKRNGFC